MNTSLSRRRIRSPVVGNGAASAVARMITVLQQRSQVKLLGHSFWLFLGLRDQGSGFSECSFLKGLEVCGLGQGFRAV